MKEKLCPLLMLGQARKCNCLGCECAWYNEDDFECAINTLGYIMGIKRNMDQIDKIGGTNE